ncbi:MAG: DUF2207 domain-containing protein [Alphaproteobacteria bacterium]|nr:DUF2207 domain-containing protein [Alphaproteobacteria bacterium]
MRPALTRAPILVLLTFLLAALFPLAALAQGSEDEGGGGGRTGGSGGSIVTPRRPAPQANLNSERILDYRSRIEVERSGAVTVTETIRVVALGRKIKRGIFRDLPTRYRTKSGARMKVGLQILDIRRDGKRENWRTESRSNGIRIYIGRKTYFLPRGIYSYTIKYRMTRMVGFFKGFDEIYWNVTGNGWAFTIERASAIIVLPSGARVMQSIGYTGRQGASGSAYIKRTGPNGETIFETTRPLRPRHGLTIAVGFAKGVVQAPSGSQRMGYFLSDNLSSIAALFGLAVLLLYYGAAWSYVGRDPAKGAIIPLYEPPHGFSPAAARYVRRMGWDNKAFAAAVVDMAVRGFLTIKEDKRKKFTLERVTEDTAALTRGEREIAGKLFKSSDTVKLVQKNHKKIRSGINALKSYLGLEFEKAYFLTNGGYMIPGVGIMVLALGGTVFGADDTATAFFIAVWLSVWTIGVYVLGAQALKAWRGGNWIGAVFMTLFFLPFLGGEIAAFVALSAMLDWPAVVAIAGMGALNGIFYQLMKAPTRAGRKIMDRLDGFAMYLSVAEKDRLNLMNPPDETPELFERFLPYALALDVEQKWSERFAGVLASAKMADGTTYHPYWYHGTSWTSLGAGGFASSLGGAFSGAISSSSTAPGSSSGSGGGGSSGGGGGGGGGGGW